MRMQYGFFPVRGRPTFVIVAGFIRAFAISEIIPRNADACECQFSDIRVSGVGKHGHCKHNSLTAGLVASNSKV
jgi:hypothetical protein